LSPSVFPVLLFGYFGSFHSVSSSPAILLFPVPTPLEGFVQSEGLASVVFFPIGISAFVFFPFQKSSFLSVSISIDLRPFASFQAFGFENLIVTVYNVASAFTALDHYYGLICNLHHVHLPCLSTRSILLLLFLCSCKKRKDDTDLPGLSLSA